jgi:hypothetical protein
MKNIFYAFLLLSSVLICPKDLLAQNNPRMEIVYYRGVQQEDFNWSIAGNSSGQNPNVYSELKWKNLRGTFNGADINVRIWKHFVVFGGYSKTTLSSGDVNDTDYGADNRTNPVYNQNFNNRGGYTDSWHAGLEFRYAPCSAFYIIPGAGYGRNRQSLNIIDESGRFSNLNSTYADSWSGPFVQVKAQYYIVPKLNVAVNCRYNQVNYQGQADWNLISQFRHPVSFTDDAKGYGVNAGAAIAYTIIPHLKVHVAAGYYYWETGKGNDRLYLQDGATDLTQFNGAYRKGYSFTGGVSFYF